MLLSSYFIPHSPVLIPRIGKTHADTLKNTKAAYTYIQSQLERDNPDTIIILSAHTQEETKTITINLAQEYSIDLTEFGDLTTRQTWRPDTEMCNHLAYEAGKLYDINLTSHAILDYGTAIPLNLLTQNLPAVKIVPISFAELPLPEMFRFGTLLEKEVHNLNRRCVILATGDLSHRLTKESANGYSKQAKPFDTTVQKALQENTFETLLDIPQDLLTEVGQCGLRSLATLAGAMEKKNMKPSTLAYENALGVGYLSAAFELK